MIRIRHSLIQYRVFRKLFGGTYYYIDVQGLSMAPFWSKTLFTSCQAKIVDIEQYEE